MPFKESSKAQLISEWSFDVLNFPKKKTTQKFDEFLPQNHKDKAPNY